MAARIDRIPLTLLTGFLGSGKTTLLQRLLREPAFAGTAVLVNELGEVGPRSLCVAPRDCAASPDADDCEERDEGRSRSYDA